MPVVVRSALVTPSRSSSATSASPRAATSESAAPGASSRALIVSQRTASSGAVRTTASPQTVTVGVAGRADILASLHGRQPPSFPFEPSVHNLEESDSEEERHGRARRRLLPEAPARVGRPPHLWLPRRRDQRVPRRARPG